MSTENKIVGSITVSAPFEKDWRTYYATVIFDLHEDGQKSLRKQDVNDGLRIVYDQDFQEEAYALMHAWDTRELQLEVEQLKRENAALREALEKFYVDDATYRLMQEDRYDCWTNPIVNANRVLRAALSPLEAARG